MTAAELEEENHVLRLRIRELEARLKASRKDDAVTVDAVRVRQERARMEITERARDIGQLCRRIERLAQRRTM